MESKFKSTTVLDLLFQAANTNPSKTYCKSADHEFTYQNFLAASIKLSKKISNTEIKNEQIGILLPNSILFLISYFAIIISGNRPALLNYLLPDVALDKLLDNLEPTLLISNKVIPQKNNMIVNIDVRAPAWALYYFRAVQRVLPSKLIIRISV